LGNVITIDDDRIKSHLDRVVRGSVKETLNRIAQPIRLGVEQRAQRYERSEARRDTRAGHYERKLQTKAGEVKLRKPETFKFLGFGPKAAPTAFYSEI
jgi:transposase-like protein